MNTALIIISLIAQIIFLFIGIKWYLKVRPYLKVIKNYERAMDVSTKTIEMFNVRVERFNKMFECFDGGMKEFKKSNIYKQYQKERNGQ